MIIKWYENHCQVLCAGGGGGPDGVGAREDGRVSSSPPERPPGFGLLVWLHGQPRWLVPVLTVLLTLGGLFLPPVAGGLCLLVVAVFLGWLASLAWPRLGAGSRLVRVAVIALVAAVAVARMAGAWET